MAASSFNLNLLLLPSSSSSSLCPHANTSYSCVSTIILKRQPHFSTCASRRPIPPNQFQESRFNRNPNTMTYDAEEDDYEDDQDEDEDEEEEERSLDLLIRFVVNVFKKISKRARKSLRSLLPINIPTDLVGFSVNGVIILAFFWILKAFLEVVCTLGSVVFVSILLVRGVWTGISYFQQGRTNEFDDDNQAWTGSQPVA